MALLTGSTGDFVRSLLSSQPYKPGQGGMARNGTLIAAGILVLGGMYAWSQTQADSTPLNKWGLPLVFGAIAGWISYRLVHYPRFADFLITTEAEMNKVSWPGRGELKASTTVVLVVFAILAVFLFGLDIFWKFVLELIGILKIGGILGPGQNA